MCVSEMCVSDVCVSDVCVAECACLRVSVSQMCVSQSECVSDVTGCHGVCVSRIHKICVSQISQGVCVRVCVWCVPFLWVSIHGVCVSRIHKIQPIAFGVWFFPFSNLNQRSIALGFFRHVPLKRDQGDWDWRLRLNDTPNAIGCMCVSDRTGCVCLGYRVAKTHRMSYVAGQQQITGLFSEKW